MVSVYSDWLPFLAIGLVVQDLLKKLLVVPFTITLRKRKQMSGLHWQNRWDPFRDFQREVGRLFESLEPAQHWRVARGVPPVNLYDAGERYILTAQLPGMGPEEVDLSITGETLTIRGDRKRPEGVAEESYRRQERQFGRWTRTVTLPDRVDSSNVAATFAHGVLTVSLPKAEESRPRQISVTAANVG